MCRTVFMHVFFCLFVLLFNEDLCPCCCTVFQLFISTICAHACQEAHKHVHAGVCLCVLYVSVFVWQFFLPTV